MNPANSGMPAIEPAARRCADGRQRHRAAQPAEHRDVARAGLVFDRAGDEEERALVAGMGEQVGEAGGDRRRRARSPNSSIRMPERTDRRVGEDALEVRLAQRADARRRSW